MIAGADAMPQAAAATRAHTAIRTPPPMRTAFALMLTYYWALQYAVTLDDPVQRGDLLYYLFVIPVAVFSLMLLFGARVSRRSDLPAFLMVLYVLSVSLVAVARGDFQTVISTGLFAASVVVVFVYRLTPSVNLLNELFLASIVVNSLSFLSGRSIYAVLPGFSADGDLWWRISLFPHIATSAFFSIIVLFMNVLHREGVLRKTCLMLAIYFLLLSGLRSALAAGLLASLYLVLARAGLLSRPSAKLVYLAASMAVFIGSLFATQLLLMLPDLGSETLNTYVFRSEVGLENEADVAKSVYRTWLWVEHLRIASENPVFGIGTFDFAALADYDPVVGEWGIGSESFLTGLYARVGLPMLLLVAAFIAAIVRGGHSGGHLSFVIGLLMFVAMVSYGSFINAYDFVFLVMIGLLADRAGFREVCARRPRPRAGRYRGAAVQNSHLGDFP